MALSKINTNQIVDGAVATADIADGLITTAKLADNAVTTAKVNPAQTDITQVGTLTSFSSTGIDDNADATTITIDSSERVGIGTASPSHQLHIESTGSNSYATMKLEGQNRGGQIDMFQNTLITNQILGDQSGNLYFNTSGAFGNSSVSTKLTLGTAGDLTVNTGDLIFGTSGKGINLGVTSNTDSNTLDDYEEGTWTASQSVAGNSSISASEAQYVKVGRMVYINVAIAFSGNDVDRVSIAGLPFTATNTSALASFFAGGPFSDVKLLVSGTTIIGSNTSGDATYTSVAGMTARFSGTYMATA